MITNDSRIYLDYNATSPLTNNVKRLLFSGDFLFANPSSQHARGKQANKMVNKTTDFLLDFFHLPKKDFKLFYHSGATEAMNTFFNLTENDALLYFVSDHPCVHSVGKHLKSRGVYVEQLDIKNDGQFDYDSVLEKIKTISLTKQNVWLNFTYMHNETGVHWDLSLASKLKSQSDVKIHVDAVQVVGKIFQGTHLDGSVDAYTFSGHKFGALKGIGFSFYKTQTKVSPLLLGGGQQGGLRSGTVNTHGIQSIYASLKDRDLDEEYKKIRKLKDKIILDLAKNEKLEVITNQSSNTICILHESMKADIMLVHFDMAGLDVSSGSACSAGSVEPSSTLLAMGKNEKAANNIRLSIGFNSLGEEENLLKSLKNVIEKI
jgi:cysteine desulfurase